MKKITLNEEQYVKLVVKECFNNNLNESIINESIIPQFLFKGCKTFKDYARRVLLLTTAGAALSFFTYQKLISSIPCGTDEEKQELLAQVTDTNDDNIIYANSFTLSEDGLNHIKKYEKLSLKPYYATKKEKELGKKTIGYGHVIKATDPEWLKTAKSITEKQAEDLLREDMKLYESELASVLKSLPERLRNANLYTQGWVDASISLIYNSGRKNFKNSDFFQTWCRCRIDKSTKKINKQDYNFTASKIKNSCVHQGNSKLNGLVQRRNDESKMAQL